MYSLYGQNRSPSPQQLAGLDALVFDIQDVGCRFYTYISTLKQAMAAASRAGLKFFVLDRPNPINGQAVEGPLLVGAPSFIACHALPVRHGLTVGELALMFKQESGLALDLRVIRVQGWHRGHVVRPNRPAVGQSFAEHAQFERGHPVSRRGLARVHRAFGGPGNRHPVRAVRGRPTSTISSWPPN